MAEHAAFRVRAVAPLATGNPPLRVLQRKCACAEAGTECERCARPLRLQRRSISTDRAPLGDAPAIVHDVLASPGRPLDAQTLTTMETRFGRSFADVRVHTDEGAAASARAINAHAYTVGSNIAFASHAFAPSTAGGQRLLAHELAHVVQQSSSGATPGLVHEHEADRAAAHVAAGQNVRIGQTAGSAIQREEGPPAEAPTAEEPVPSFIGNRAVAFITDMLPFGTTSRIASAALSGLTTGAIKELKGGGKGAVLFRAIKDFRAANVPEVMGGYLAGLGQGVVSPVTDLFKLGQFVEHIGRMGANFFSGPMARHKDLVNDLNNLLPSAASLSTALDQSFKAFKDHPLDTITALITAPFNLSVTAEKKAYQFGVEHGREMIDSMVAPVDPKAKQPEAEPQQKSEGWLDRIAGFAGAVHDKLVQGAWTKMGEKIGYAIGWAVINAAMLIFSEGIGNAVVEGAAALAKFGETLGAFGKLVTGMAEVLAGVGKAIAIVEKLVNSVMGLLLKPLEKLLKPFLEPFAKFLQALGAFLRKFLGIAEKEGATLAAEAAAKGVSAATAPAAHAPPPAPHTAPAPHMAAHEAPAPHAAPHVQPTETPAASAHGAPTTRASAEPSVKPHEEPVPAASQTPTVDQAKIAARAAMRKKLPEGISEETLEMLEKNPELFEALAANPEAARAFTLCHSECVPKFAEAEQIRRVARLLAKARQAEIAVDEVALKEFLHNTTNQAQLSRSISKFEREIEARLANPDNMMGSLIGRSGADPVGLENLEAPLLKRARGGSIENTAVPKRRPEYPPGVDDMVLDTEGQVRKGLGTKPVSPKTAGGSYAHQYFEDLPQMSRDQIELMFPQGTLPPGLAKEVPVHVPEYAGRLPRIDRVNQATGEIIEIGPSHLYAQKAAEAQWYADMMNKYEPRPDGIKWWAGEPRTYNQQMLQNYFKKIGLVE